MHIACYNNNLDCIKYLFTVLGPNCFLEKDSYDKTCLDVAISCENKEISNWIESIQFIIIFFFFEKIFIKKFLKIGKLLKVIWKQIINSNEEQLDKILKSLDVDAFDFIQKEMLVKFLFIFFFSLFYTHVIS